MSIKNVCFLKRLSEDSPLPSQQGTKQGVGTTYTREFKLITNSYLVKGLEFDYVILPNVTADEYHTGRDRQLLYIAGTRALHKLDVMYYGNRSTFIDDAIK